MLTSVIASYAQSSVAYNRILEYELQNRWNMSLRIYSALETLYEILAVALIGFAIYNGADPLLAILVGAVLIQGPRVMAYWLVISGDVGEGAQKALQAIVDDADLQDELTNGNHSSQQPSAGNGGDTSAHTDSTGDNEDSTE